MPSSRLDVLCIGNAIVDVIADTDDAFLDAEGLTTGSMRLIDAEEAERLYDHMGPARSTSTTCVPRGSRSRRRRATSECRPRGR